MLIALRYIWRQLSVTVGSADVPYTTRRPRSAIAAMAWSGKSPPSGSKTTVGAYADAASASPAASVTSTSAAPSSAIAATLAALLV